ncbi:hypothetical protein NQ317_017965 [Molorchus minor]|uniref:Ankyrin repeat protein n=1 Tax=Molorchus minor TaxID=1323400 RepID=A0ABQ9JMG1_9CUCU|nr:hypothetical protein NQ317_017965 [Molorchus minor]
MHSNLPATFEIKSEEGRRRMELIFFHAVEQSNVSLARDCINKGVSPNTFNDHHLAPLHLAAAMGDMHIGLLLMNHPKTNLNLTTPTGQTALILACLYDKRPFLKALLAKGADPNIESNKGQTALHIACKNRFIAMVTDLTSAGANLNVLDTFDNTPLSIAVTNYPSEPIARHLMKKGARATEVKDFPLLLECVLHCHSSYGLQILKLLLMFDVDIKCVHPVTKMNCLHYTGITGYSPAAEQLLVNGANLHQIDRMGRTPLQVAEDHENRDVALLFERWVEKRKVYFAPSENIVEDIHTLYD